MKSPKLKPTIDGATVELRKILRSVAPGEMLGTEESIIGQLGVSRATVRQIARLLEKEGLLKVRRGTCGGYYASRPDLEHVGHAVSTYLETLETDVEEATIIGAALWLEAIRKAAKVKSPAAIALAQSLRDKVAALGPDTPFDDILEIEKEIREEIFELINSRYIELIFHINVTFARHHYRETPGIHDHTPEHKIFVQSWRKAKLLEMDAVIDGDPEIAVIAARHSRKLWFRRILGSDIY